MECIGGRGVSGAARKASEGHVMPGGGWGGGEPAVGTGQTRAGAGGRPWPRERHNGARGGEDSEGVTGGDWRSVPTDAASSCFRWLSRTAARVRAPADAAGAAQGNAPRPRQGPEEGEEAQRSTHEQPAKARPAPPRPACEPCYHPALSYPRTLAPALSQARLRGCAENIVSLRAAREASARMPSLERTTRRDSR